MVKKIDDVLNRPAGLTWMMVLFSAVSFALTASAIKHIDGGDTLQAVVSGVCALVMIYLLSRVALVIERRLKAAEPQKHSCLCGEVTTLLSPTDTAVVGDTYHRGDGPCFITEDPIKAEDD